MNNQRQPKHKVLRLYWEYDIVQFRADGGYLVPAELERQVTLRLAQISPIRSIAGNRQVSGAVFNKPYSASGPAVGWVAETGSRPQTANQQLQQLAFPTMELYAMPAATQALLDDAAIDVESWIAEEVQQAFAEQEGAAFVRSEEHTSELQSH
mgnify:CR=1 FL=1